MTEAPAYRNRQSRGRPETAAALRQMIPASLRSHCFELWAWLMIVLVAGVTAAARSGVVSVIQLASSPKKIAEGRLWLLISNGAVVQRPIALSLVSFALLILFTLSFCGPLILFGAAAAGHVGSTLLAYSLVLAISLVDPSAVRGVLSLPDYGVSARQAAWIGAIAAIAWRREGQSPRGRVPVVCSCGAIAGFRVPRAS